MSKRQIMGMEWDSAVNKFFLIIPIAVLLGVFGGISSSSIIGTEWPGITAGLLLSVLLYPLVQKFSEYSLEKHKKEVVNTARQLSELVSQSARTNKNKKKTTKKSRSTAEIEIPDEEQGQEQEQEAAELGSRKLRNNLRE